MGIFERAPKSTVVIAKLLGSEGFSDHTANMVERYWKNAVMTERKKHRVASVERAFSELAAKLTDGERIILGKWIGLHKKMSFDTGIRIGLAAFAVKHVEDEKWDADATDPASSAAERTTRDAGDSTKPASAREKPESS